MKPSGVGLGFKLDKEENMFGVSYSNLFPGLLQGVALGFPDGVNRRSDFGKNIAGLKGTARLLLATGGRKVTKRFFCMALS